MNLFEVRWDNVELHLSKRRSQPLLHEQETRAVPLKQLIVERHQVLLLHGTAPLDAVTVNRLDHDSLAVRFAKHFRNAIPVLRKHSAGWSTANAGSGVFHQHRAQEGLLQHVESEQGARNESRNK